MRWLAILVVATVMTTSAVARPSPPPPPPQCLGPDTWERLVKCLAEDEPSLNVVVDMSEHARGTTDSTHRWGRIYFQNLDGKWTNLRAYATTVEVVGDTTTATPTTARGTRTIRRLELREVLDYGNRTQVRLKSAVVCGAAPSAACQIHAYECTAIQAGRAIDVAKGDVHVSPANGQIELDVDRSRASSVCASF